MRRIILFLAVIITCLISCGNKNDFTKASKSSKSVVLLRILKGNKSEKYASGVIIEDNGYILTCNHATENSDTVLVIYNSDTLLSRLVGFNKNLDISLLKVEKNLPKIDIGNSDNIKIGQNILNIGYPLSIGLTVNSGIISAVTPIFTDSTHRYYINCIQTDAVLNPGNSGGALVNERGKLIGINNMLYTSTGYYMGYSFAVPINDIMITVNKLIKKDK